MQRAIMFRIKFAFRQRLKAALANFFDFKEIERVLFPQSWKVDEDGCARVAPWILIELIPIPHHPI